MVYAKTFLLDQVLLEVGPALKTPVVVQQVRTAEKEIATWYQTPRGCGTRGRKVRRTTALVELPKAVTSKR